MHQLATKWADIMIQNGLDPTKKAVYVYGLECIINELVSDAILLVIGLCMGKLIPMAIWIISFTLLRVHTGGYHANSHLGCLISSILTGSLCVNLYSYLNGSWRILFCCLFSYAVLLLITPVIHKNHPVSEARFRHARKYGLIVGALEAMASIGLHSIYPTAALMILTGMLSTCLLAIIGYWDQNSIRNRKQP